MKILALESANEQCSVALIDGSQLVYFKQYDEPRAQTQQILPMIERALKQSQTTWQDLSAIAFSRGPGSFSGVRINAAVTQALAWANDLPVIAVSTLQALAQQAYRKEGLAQVTTVLDARMQEVYFAQFALNEQGIMQVVGEEQLLSYDQAIAQIQYPVVGSGAALLGHQSYTKIRYANAQDIAEIAQAEFHQGHTVSADQALPVYLRDNAWKKISEQNKSSS
ncbi:MAG: tRNA (adenosine(37)-N6)-threonylcarbamoyltransferase complex dimerization subunit type 1 TsaB [Acinetobacter populi]|uniref:tRNA (adenosine(37)-N6)-threonylcarbamoyltransferase complex dimerization subunit type 1 TsaB n=1 Tax=Acinetobacter populi TaxID=1582270 RepID=UPI0023522D13|nr:tRNA (adenosine(37)-N6)-threonylcarbamoyltransferase complex dimerization subunit type 1 TsaB [Acinetobacter populi]MCH4246374.1 tRNA (adenosine(37)-N6)-threonylcarbamoyltransferase complex dimerization subunit type 1 TsaB [Acinetobacter populi]